MGLLTLGHKIIQTETVALSQIEKEIVYVDRVVIQEVERLVPFETVVEREVVKEVEVIKEKLVPFETVVEKIVVQEVPILVDRVVEVEKVVVKEIEKLVQGPVQFIHKIVPKEHLPKWAVLLMAIEALVIILILVRHIS